MKTKYSFIKVIAFTFVFLLNCSNIKSQCVTPPAFDVDLTPTAVWQTHSSSFVASGCVVYRIYMTTTNSYDFSCCINDAVGGDCTGDADFTFYDPTGTQIWYIDGQAGCGWDASTIGSPQENYIPPADGFYYLKVDDYYGNAASYTLAYQLIDLTCTHTVALHDDFGDGWNGGTLTVNVNGTPVLTNITLATGTGPQNFTFSAMTGDAITTSYTAGGWGYENFYFIYDGNGTEICSDGIGGVQPTASIACTANCINNPKTLNSITYNQASIIEVGVGSTNQEILRLDFDVTGATGTLNLNSLVVSSNNMDDADIAAGGVKLYRTTTTTFATTNQLGTAQSFSAGTATFSGLVYDLPVGMTYVWVVYDISGSALAGNTVDAFIAANNINVEGSTYPAANQSPVGTRTIGYCSAAGGCGEYISRVRLNTLDNNNGICSGYADYTAMSTNLNTESSYLLTVDVVGALHYFPFDSLSVWVDWNNDFDFGDANESIIVFDNPGEGPFTGIVTVPAGTTLGNKRMRVRLIEGYNNYSATPCGTSGDGEVEDYTINVVNTGAPNVTVSIDEASPVEICRGEIQSLNATANITVGSITGYMWYYNLVTTGITATNYSATENGFFNVVVFSSTGEVAISEDFDLTVHDIPLGGIFGTNTICEGNSATLSYSISGNGPFDVVYEPGSVSENNVWDLSTFSVSPTSDETYYLSQITDVNGCVTNVGTATNLLKNPAAEDGMNDWTITTNGGNGWTTIGTGAPYFVTSYDLCEREQVIDLIAEGYTPAQLDAEPLIYVGERYKGKWPQYNDTYYLKVTLEDASNNPIATFDTGNLIPGHTNWHMAAYIFSAYGPGVRYIRFEDGGDDAEWWAGHYGTIIDDGFVYIGSMGNLVTADITVTHVTEGDVTGGGNVCYGSPGTALTLTGYTGTIPNWQYSTDGGTTWTDIVNTADAYTDPALTQNTLFRAAVTASGCTEYSLEEEVTVNAYPADVTNTDGATGVCYVDGAAEWVHIVDASNDFLASVRGVGLQNTDSEITLFDDGFGVPEPQYHNTEPYLSRVTYIEPTVDGAAEVTLYFTQAEFAALQAVEPSLTALSQLTVSKFDHGTWDNGVLLTPTSINANTPHPGIHSITVSVTGFSDFYVHRNRGWVLPVSLASFNADCKDDHVQITWITTSEANNDYFTIEKSYDGKSFFEIAEIDGAGSTSEETEYIYKDPETNQTSYYRLKQTDYDGTVSVEDIIACTCNENNQFELITYHVDESDLLNVTVRSVDEEKYTVTLIDQQGKVLYTNDEFKPEGIHHTKIPLSTYSPGIYMLLVHNNNNLVSKKILH